MPKYRQPTLGELFTWVKTHKYVYYQGPMDHSPAIALVSRYTINNINPEASRFTLWSRGTQSFDADRQHFDRFRIPAPEAPVKQLLGK
jgi:hypothetical protein